MALAEQGRGSQSKLYLAIIRQFHEEEGLASATEGKRVRKAAEGAIRLASKKKDWPREREPFQLEALRAWLETPRASSPFLHTRDAALVILGFRAMLRPGELSCEFGGGAWKSDAVNLYLIPKSLSARVGKAMGL